VFRSLVVVARRGALDVPAATTLDAFDDLVNVEMFYHTRSFM
jgi:hypothetical protein